MQARPIGRPRLCEPDWRSPAQKHANFADLGNRNGRLHTLPARRLPQPPCYPVETKRCEKALGDAPWSRCAADGLTHPNHCMERVVVRGPHAYAALPVPVAFLRRRQGPLGNNDLAAEMAPCENACLDGLAPHKALPRPQARCDQRANIPTILVTNTSIPMQKLKIRIIPHRIRPYLSDTGPLPFRASTLRQSPGPNKGDFLDLCGADPLARFDNDD